MSQILLAQIMKFWLLVKRHQLYPLKNKQTNKKTDSPALSPYKKKKKKKKEKKKDRLEKMKP